MAKERNAVRVNDHRHFVTRRRLRIAYAGYFQARTGTFFTALEIEARRNDLGRIFQSLALKLHHDRIQRLLFDANYRCQDRLLHVDCSVHARKSDVCGTIEDESNFGIWDQSM